EYRGPRVRILDALDEVPRPGVELDVQTLLGAVEEVEDTPERVGKGGGRVLHPRGLEDAAAPPRLVAPLAPRGARKAEGDERQRERHREGEGDREHRERREAARDAERQPVADRDRGAVAGERAGDGGEHGDD